MVGGSTTDITSLIPALNAATGIEIFGATGTFLVTCDKAMLFIKADDPANPFLMWSRDYNAIYGIVSPDITSVLPYIRTGAGSIKSSGIETYETTEILDTCSTILPRQCKHH